MAMSSQSLVLALLAFCLLSLAGTTTALFQERFVTQRLVPIDRLDTRTWQNRYFIDDSAYVPGGGAGALFVFCGGSDFYFTEGRRESSHFFDIGRRLQGVLVFTEHRYYGKSRPTQ